MNSITCYNFNGADVRTVVLPNGEPGFVGKDVAERLGYVDTAQAIRQHCRGALLQQPIPDALGRLQQTRILAEPDVLRLIVSSTLPEAEAFERWVFEEVLPSIRRTGSYTARPAGGPSNLEQLQMAEVLASALRLDGSSRLKLMADATKLLAPALAPLLPVYAIDAPAGAPAVSSAPTESLTSLMARHRVGVSSRAGNLILQERGLLEKRTRPSSAGGTKSFWSVTEKGLAFGKNVSSPENPRETQPHWFSAKGEELLRVMGVLE